MKPVKNLPATRKFPASSTDNTSLPPGWTWTTLGEVLDFVKGKKPRNLGPKDAVLTIPYINIEAFEKKIFEQYTDGEDCPHCEPTDILIVWDGARCGLVGRGVAGAIGSTLAKLVYYQLNSSYLFYFLQTKYEDINKRPRGVGIPHVEPNLFWNLSFPLPPLPEQRRIVAKIEELFSKLDAGVEALKKVKAELKRYRQAVLKYAFEGKLTEEWREAHNGELEPASVLLERIKEQRKKKLGSKYKDPRQKDGGQVPPLDTSELPDLPEGWAWARLGDVVEDVQSVNPKIKPEKEFTYLDIASIDNTIQRITEPKVYYGKSAPSRARQLVKAGDILFSTVRTYLKNFAVVDEVYDGQIASTGFCVIRPHKEISNKCVFYYVQTNEFLNPLNQIQRGTSYPAVRDSDVFAQPIPLPPLAEQQQIVSEIERRFSVADEVEKVVDQSLKQAERLRQSILKRAFEGNLVPQDPTDPPAIQLLEEIRKQKENAAATTRKGQHSLRRASEPASVLVERIKKEKERQTAKNAKKRKGK